MDKAHIQQLLQPYSLHIIEITQITESNTALTIKLTAKVSDGSTKKLFVKTMKPNKAENVYHSKNMRESEFYRLVKENNINSAPLPTCHVASSCQEKGEFLIILDDVSGEYTAPGNAALQSNNTWLRCAESLAKLHAAFWEHSIIAAMQEEYLDETATQTYINKLKERLGLFISHFSDNFDTQTKETLTKAAEINILQVKETASRIIANRNVTICNGDSHIHNFMLPVTEGGLPLVVDFQFWGEGIGTGDLAHLTRVKFAKPGLQLAMAEHYYETLLASGVVGYSWEACWHDYRISAASMVLIPMWQYSGFKMPYSEWKDALQDLTRNFHYLECEDIL